ncbi:hypothetical protein JX265_013866 [Neoarthrinium moseri]|uniref:Uncharacterized protein n=1 Tax=Neoarthrinium moseri TaxID=1658444 RepID=A0A9P9W7U0_9PEZI|nr:hypothetical protein JX266_008531 [Neoarthrinium moseri]KAI1848093.1 hypothetical protein JX265_013866 [Neoarthrinium moseri]
MEGKLASYTYIARYDPPNCLDSIPMRDTVEEIQGTNEDGKGISDGSPVSDHRLYDDAAHHRALQRVRCVAEERRRWFEEPGIGCQKAPEGARRCQNDALGSGYDVANDVVRGGRCGRGRFRIAGG